MRKNKYMLSFLFLGLITFLCLSCASTEEAGRQLEDTKIGIGSTEIESGQTADIPVNVYRVASANPEEGGGMGGYHMRVEYTPGVIEVVDIAGGEAPFDTVLTKNINNAEGWAEFIGLQSNTNGPEGDFGIALIKVKAIGERGSNTELKTVIKDLIYTDGSPITAVPDDGSVNVK